MKPVVSPQTTPLTWSLDGDAWRLRHFPDAPGMPDTPARARAANAPELPARVPGNVELDLVRAGELEEPFFGLNAEKLRPLEFHQWWLEREFATPEVAAVDRLELVFEGLDCFATVWVNDIRVGESANAMIAHRFDVTDALAPAGKTNCLTVRLRSAVNAVRDIPLDTQDRAQPQCLDGLWARKPAHCYGWDIAPRVVSAGIWRPVFLEQRRPTELTDVFFRMLRVTAAEAELSLRYSFRTDAPDFEGFEIRIEGECGDSRFAAAAPVFFNQGNLGVRVTAPRLWWPRGYGEANLYRTTITLLHHGKPVSVLERPLGIRTIELERTDLNTTENPGKFLFKVNGVPIFVKGSNWVPADAFHSRDAERIPRMLELFRDMGCNMVRCWGGNVYEAREFYDICDREGILVWQDFSMACASYPQREEFLEMMREEAEWVVRTLRGHPCIALWAGDNECDVGIANWWGQHCDPGKNRITREVLPEVIRRLDPERAYLPSSPYISPAVFAAGGSQYLGPEQHPWGPRDYYKSAFYARNTACFASEIGYHGCPDVRSIRRFISPEALWPWQDNREWQLHGTDPVIGLSTMKYRVKLMADQITEVFGFVPEDLETFALASQIVQAEAKKFFVEIFRSRKWRTSGVLWWNMIDCWPQFSDAVVDYYFSRKLAYHYLKRVHAPVCVMLREPESWNCAVVAGNDSRVAAQGRVAVRDADTGEVVLETAFAVPANENATIGQIRTPRGIQRLLLIEWETERGRGVNHYLAGTPPFAFARYRDWLPKLAALDGSFDPAAVAR